MTYDNIKSQKSHPPPHSLIKTTPPFWVIPLFRKIPEDENYCICHKLKIEYYFSAVGSGIVKGCELPHKYAWSFLSTL